MIEIETKYNKGDVVTINEKDWTITSIFMRFGRVYNYQLERETKVGKMKHITIETSSLETLLGHSDDNNISTNI